MAELRVNERTAVGVDDRSRAVVRDVKPASYVSCAGCGEVIRYRTRPACQQVICNVYEDGFWARAEHYHPECYSAAGTPYGAPQTAVSRPGVGG
ncbi:MAG: hypothetical protein U0Q22_08445 [Acidimicrobiales bacterium]